MPFVFMVFVVNKYYINDYKDPCFFVNPFSTLKALFFGFCNVRGLAVVGQGDFVVFA